MDILIVDDELDICEILEALLKKEGFNVAYCQDADSALKMIQKHNPTLLISDITMPGKNGLQLIEELKSQGKIIAVVMLTAHSESEVIIQALQLGAIDYLIKPFDSDELCKKLPSWTEIGRRLQGLSSEKIDSTEALQKKLRMIELFKLKNKQVSIKVA